MKNGSTLVTIGLIALAITQTPAVVPAQPQDADQRACVATMNRGMERLSSVQAKAMRLCVKRFAKGRNASAENCIDGAPKVAQAAAKTCADELRRCDGVTPDFARTDCATVNRAAKLQQEAWLRDVLGAAVDESVVDCASDQAGCRCQDAALDGASKLFRARLKEFNRCKKAGLESGVIAGAADLESCYAEDPRDKVARAKANLLSKLNSSCGSSGNVFPGRCEGLSGIVLGECLARRVECRACLTLNQADGLDRDCDLFDDQVANGSCCPGATGVYTITSVAGGTMSADGLPAFPVPAGGQIITDVGEPGPGCVHPVIVPFPGGFTNPSFCLSQLGFSVSIAQTGCGAGSIDSDGGSDFNIAEIGDSSSPILCGLAGGCVAGANSDGQVDVTVGDGVADTCAGSGRANALVSIPVHATTWVGSSPSSGCPDADGRYDPGTDILVVSFPAVLDFTTDRASASWQDLDPDGCFIAGAGPAAGMAKGGSCLDVTGSGIPGVDIVAAAATTVPSAGSPLFDLTVAAVLPAEVTGPGPSLGATCASPPIIPLGGGTATRCVP